MATAPEREVVSSRLVSPGHCTNITAPRFTAMDVAVEIAPRSVLRIFCAQVFASRR